MKAARLVKQDEKAALVIEEMAKPAPAADQLLVEVRAAGVNPADWKIKAGYMPVSLPATMGADFAGVVVETGADVTGFTPGDEIYGMAGPLNGKGSGSFAEYEAVDASAAAPKPKNISQTQAAALPLTGIMALQALTEHFKLQTGQKLLIQGGAGGIGSIAIQIAKKLGAHVTVTCAGDEFEYVKSLGADEAIDYETQKFEEIISGHDAAYDLVGGEVYERSFQVLKPGGTIVSSLMPPDEALMKKYGVNAVFQLNEVTPERLGKLAELVDAGVIRVHVDKTFPLAAVGEALDYLETAHPRGKVVIVVS